jgi:hypothetical protein
MVTNGSTGVRKQDGLKVFTSVAKNPIGVDIAFDYLFKNIEKIYE